MAGPKDGGSAFPVGYTYSEYNRDADRTDIDTSITPGMTLRDYFAAKAMAALAIEGRRLEMWSTIGQGDATPHIARVSYLIADAMLAERSK